MTGTVTVTVHAFTFHPIYKKRFRKSKKFMADTNGQQVNEGDTVIIVECRPLSKNKRFKVQEVLQKAAQVSEIVEETDLQKTIVREKHTPENQKKEKSSSAKE
jgi:small subunit ribosomal protein S17